MTSITYNEAQLKVFLSHRWDCSPHDIRVVSSRIGGRGPKCFAVNGNRQVPLVDFYPAGEVRYALKGENR